jgi:hypothetical protein
MERFLIIILFFQVVIAKKYAYWAVNKWEREQWLYFNKNDIYTLQFNIRPEFHPSVKESHIVLASDCINVENVIIPCNQKFGETELLNFFNTEEHLKSLSDDDWFAPKVTIDMTLLQNDKLESNSFCIAIKFAHRCFMASTSILQFDARPTLYVE